MVDNWDSQKQQTVMQPHPEAVGGVIRGLGRLVLAPLRLGPRLIREVGLKLVLRIVDGRLRRALCIVPARLRVTLRLLSLVDTQSSWSRSNSGSEKQRGRAGLQARMSVTVTR